MAAVKVLSFPATYRRQELNKISAFSFEEIEKLLEYTPSERLLIEFMPYGFGGNHKHQRIESWVGFGGNLELMWIEVGKRNVIHMNSSDPSKLFIVTIERNVPHVIRNMSKNTAHIVEFADSKMINPEQIDVINYVNKDVKNFSRI